MLRKLRSRLTYANVMATLGPVRRGWRHQRLRGQHRRQHRHHRRTGQVSADVKDQSLTTFDVSPSSAPTWSMGRSPALISRISRWSMRMWPPTR